MKRERSKVYFWMDRRKAKRGTLTQHIQSDVGGHGDAQAICSFAGDDTPKVLSTHSHTHLGSVEKKNAKIMLVMWI